MNELFRFLLRFRYPVALPEEVAQALGVEVSNFMTFRQFIKRLTCPSCTPTRLCRYMEREQAEEAFQNAHRIERFTHSTLISFYFPEGWMEFSLEFDQNSLLRRLYVQHKQIQRERGVEIALK